LGGAYAYYKSKSEKSLLSSLIFAGLYAVGGYFSESSGGNLGLLISFGKKFFHLFKMKIGYVF
jgi:uncharacterized membrane protein (UPF0136 family)